MHIIMQSGFTRVYKVLLAVNSTYNLLLCLATTNTQLLHMYSCIATLEIETGYVIKSKGSLFTVVIQITKSTRIV